MRFSEIEDGEQRLERLKTELDTERLKRESAMLMKWSTRLPWIVVGAAGWFFFLLAITEHHR